MGRGHPRVLWGGGEGPDTEAQPIFPEHSWLLPGVLSGAWWPPSLTLPLCFVPTSGDSLSSPRHSAAALLSGHFLACLLCGPFCPNSGDLGRPLWLTWWWMGRPVREVFGRGLGAVTSAGVAGGVSCRRVGLWQVRGWAVGLDVAPLLRGTSPSPELASVPVLTGRTQSLAQDPCKDAEGVSAPSSPVTDQWMCSFRPQPGCCCPATPGWGRGCAGCSPHLRPAWRGHLGRGGWQLGLLCQAALARRQRGAHRGPWLWALVLSPRSTAGLLQPSGSQGWARALGCRCWPGLKQGSSPREMSQPGRPGAAAGVTRPTRSRGTRGPLSAAGAPLSLRGGGFPGRPSRLRPPPPAQWPAWGSGSSAGSWRRKCCVQFPPQSRTVLSKPSREPEHFFQMSQQHVSGQGPA